MISNKLIPCPTCEIGIAPISVAEMDAACKGVSLIERVVFLDVVNLASGQPEMTVQQALAINGCIEARQDRRCARYAE